MDIVHAQNWFFVLFSNLMQIDEKAHVPVTVRFPNYAFNENIHMYCFYKWYVSWYSFLFMTDTKIKECVSFESWEKKEL